jgi:hypothetical protein
MTTTLYDATVLTYLQMLGALEGVLARGLDHCRDSEIDPQSLVETRLHADMLPFRFQVLSTVTHSIGAIEGVRKGIFSPKTASDASYVALQSAVSEARKTLGQVSADEVNGFTGRDVTFQFGELKIPFTAENFLLSFSVPNFYFHVSMTYGILRSKGVPLGKRDFMGQLRIKR